MGTKPLSYFIKDFEHFVELGILANGRQKIFDFSSESGVPGGSRTHDF